MNEEERPLPPEEAPEDRPQPPAEAQPSPPLSLRKQLDRDLEDDLEAALAEIDTGALDDLLGQGAELSAPARERADEEQTSEASEVRKGRVIAVQGADIFVDLGEKSEGLLPARLFEGEEVPQVGATVEVVVDRFDANEGVLLLTRKGAPVEADWENLREGLVVEARVTGTNRGGLVVDVNGVRGFVPASQVDVVRVPELNVFSGQRLRCIVTEANRRERNLVLSRRAVLEEELAEARRRTWDELAEGQVRSGVVKSIKPFGAFVDVGGVDGLLHVSQMSWGHVDDPGEVVHPGQQIDVKIVKVNREKQKVSLGLKQLQPSPWEGVEEKYPLSSLVGARVTRVVPFGAFAELEPGVEGLIHISEIAPQRVHRVTDYLSEGQEVTVQVLAVDREQQRISLSLKGATADEPAHSELEEAENEPAPEVDSAPPPPKRDPDRPLKGGIERID